MKKILLFLAILAAVTGNAGTWKVHSCYQTSKIQNVYDTGDKIYYLNSGSLFQFDKATAKTVALNRQNMLSDNQISQIYYDWQSQLVFVVYANCNIDIIDNAGVVYNVSKLKDICGMERCEGSWSAGSGTGRSRRSSSGSGRGSGTGRDCRGVSSVGKSAADGGVLWGFLICSGGWM